MEDTVEGIRKLAGNASLAEKMGRDARRYITEHFAADKVLFEFEQMVQKLSKINGKKDFNERHYIKGDHTDR